VLKFCEKMRVGKNILIEKCSLRGSSRLGLRLMKRILSNADMSKKNIRETIVKYIFIGKQNIVLYSKFSKN
jgi:hypothetical protein